MQGKGKKEEVCRNQKIALKKKGERKS